MKFDVGFPATFKYGIVVLATAAAGMSTFLVLIMLMGGLIWKVAAVVLACIGVWLWLMAVLAPFRYRAWLDGTTLCVQKSFKVRRCDLAQAASVDVEVNNLGVLFLTVHGGGRKHLSVRMATSEGRALPQHQLEAVADAIACGSASDAPGMREALARLGVTR